MPNRSLLPLILLLILLVAGFWLGVQSRAQMLGALAVVSTAVVCASWYRRVRAERRWRAVWAAYAARDLAQQMSR